jgi:MoxR-like ATPase
MSEEQVSIENQTLPLKRPFMVVATQNPTEFEGTYQLPENQLDRFLLRITMGYPDRKAEHQILVLQPSRSSLEKLTPVMHGQDVVELQDRTPHVKLDSAIVEYILDLATATRKSEELHLGVSPRGALALTQASQALAVIRGRNYVTPDDVKQLFLPVCAHRVVGKSYLSNGNGSAVGMILQGILDRTPTPR